MKIALVALVTAAAAALVAAGAAANGSPYSPGLVYGWDGVRAPGGEVRYVTLGTPRSTLVAAIRVSSGRVLRTNVLRGFYGVPLVAYDGSSGGLSGDRRTLVVASYGPLPGKAGTTRFAVLDTKALRMRRIVELSGSWSFDAISPDGSSLYLVEHLSAPPTARYRVRIYDLAAGRLLAGAIVDRLEKAQVMGGEPATRAMSTDGRWAYTLYARRKAHPFVHALDTERKQAYCIDLPVRLEQGRQMALRLKLEGQKLVVRDLRSPLVVVDTKTFVVKQIQA